MKLTKETKESILNYLKDITKDSDAETPDISDVHVIEDFINKDAQIKQLIHYRDSTGGLWCIDRNPKEINKDWINRNAFQITQ